MKDTKSGLDTEDTNEDSGKTPGYIKGNKFFGIPLTESITGSPRWAASKPPKKAPIDKPDVFSDTVEEPPSNDGQTLVQQLKKQISDNRKTLVTLFMELDEERSAAAVAANNAMAMITRLQAEKAGVHMEALQYQRMMDEQAEYDEEAIQILRDLFFKKEEDVKVLEDELEMYRVRYGELKKFGSDDYDFDAEEYYEELQSQSYGEKSESGSLVEDGGNRKGNHEEASVNFENERTRLFGMLKDFENYHARSSSHEDRHHKHTGKGSNVKLLKDVSLLMEKLTAMEAESGFLKHAAMTLEKGDEGTKVVSEIAEHLRKIPSPQKPEYTNTINA
ncbi:Zein-binding domain-containing protein [Cynara cardunculus var. scolymus]|uniref:Zein-binding domain-containing protein n=1 Tax=Cynara cardunculus var. scolymus TaxID=59895 RepID=A0A118JZ36_CYNCS|nr:Zein-binding domain-containing protein [Cynara cardunculus var. scolymus]